MLPRELDPVTDGIAVAEHQGVDDADGCASQRVSVEQPGEVVQFQPRKRINSKGVRSWRAEATGASCWQDAQLLVEFKVHPLADAVWRPAAEVARERTAVRQAAVSGNPSASEAVVAGLARGIRTGAAMDILQALRSAHGRFTLPADSGSSPAAGGAVGEMLQVGVDVSFMQVVAGSCEPVTVWGRVLAKDADCEPLLLKVAVFQPSGDESVLHSCDNWQWVCASDVALAGVFFKKDASADAYVMLPPCELSFLEEEAVLESLTHALNDLAATLSGEAVTPTSDALLVSAGKVVELYPAACPECGCGEDGLERTRTSLDKYGLNTALDAGQVLFFLRC